jgi:hypothetical protein
MFRANSQEITIRIYRGGFLGRSEQDFFDAFSDEVGALLARAGQCEFVRQSAFGGVSPSIGLSLWRIRPTSTGIGLSLWRIRPTSLSTGIGLWRIRGCQRIRSTSVRRRFPLPPPVFTACFLTDRRLRLPLLFFIIVSFVGLFPLFAQRYRVS